MQRFEGELDGVFHREIDVVDLSTGTVSTSPYPLPNPLRRALSSAILGEEILLVGGIGEGATHFKLLDRVTAFNPQTGQFRELEKLPMATFAPATGVIGDEVFVFGGMFEFLPKEFSYVNHIFALKSGNWRHTGRYLHETKGFSQVVPLEKGALGILGGHSYAGGNAPVLTLEKFGIGTSLSMDSR